MNMKLQQLLDEFANGDGEESVTAIEKVEELQLTESDFSDELFDTFEAKARKLVYMGIQWWFARRPATGLQILEHRLAIENDSNCKKWLEFYIGSWTEPNEAKRAYRRTMASVELPEKERTPENARMVRDAIVEYLHFIGEPVSKKAQQSKAIRDLKPTDEDFDDEFLDSLAPRTRLEVYANLLFWCGYAYLKKVLDRRVRLETDRVCNRAIATMLRSFQ